jgi:hypothetical protein
VRPPHPEPNPTCGSSAAAVRCGTARRGRRTRCRHPTWRERSAPIPSRHRSGLGGAGLSAGPRHSHVFPDHRSNRTAQMKYLGAQCNSRRLTGNSACSVGASCLVPVFFSETTMARTAGDSEDVTHRLRAPAARSPRSGKTTASRWNQRPSGRLVPRQPPVHQIDRLVGGRSQYPSTTPSDFVPSRSRGGAILSRSLSTSVRRRSGE